MAWLGGVLFVAFGIGYMVIQRVVRRWVARQWIDERISNLKAVVFLLLTSGFGLGMFFVIGAVLLNPSADVLLGLLPLLIIGMVMFGFGMTAINYAAMHGVREHWRAQRDRQQQARKP